MVIPEHSKAELRSYQPGNFFRIFHLSLFLFGPCLVSYSSIVYSTAHFEGSLGKLQVMSVNCPRRMIDLDLVHPDDAESETQKVANRELKRYRQLLLEIEKV